MFKYTINVIILLFVISGYFALSCSKQGNSDANWQAESTLRIGTDATYPPFEMVNTESGQPEGFDIDIIMSVCEENGWHPELIVTPFDGIISGLKSDKYDCVISAMSVTPQRAAVVSFSDPYYLAGQVVAVPLGDTLIKSADDLRGLKVGVQLGTTGERMAKSLEGVSVFSFDNIGAAFIDMENGHVDAVLNDLPTTREYIKRRGNAKIVGELLSEESYGIAVRSGNTVLLDKINDALAKIKTSGEYKQIEHKWFGSEPVSDQSLPDSAQ